MIEDWTSYRLTDFIMLSARVHDRQIELLNQGFAGLQIVSVLAGLFLIWAGLRRTRGAQAVAFALIGAAWVFVAWAFLWERYAAVNVVGAYAAPLFALQGIGLVVLALSGVRMGFGFPMGRWRVAVSVLLLAACAVAYPLFSLALGRPPLQAEFFGMMPDPTALATLCVLALATHRVRYVLMVVPVLWCVVSVVVQVELGVEMAWGVMGLGLFASILAFSPGQRASQ